MVSYITQVRMAGGKIVNVGYAWPTFPVKGGSWGQFFIIDNLDRGML
jgi:hypothetical protein